MNKIGKRLEVIASLVGFRKICDVGCDHGKLAHFLFNNGQIDYAVVSDISMPSLQKAIDILSKSQYNFDYICCDGLSGYNGFDVEQCVISGMGGDEIIKIISNSPITIDSFILSPQHNIIEVKKFMLDKGYDIDYDIVVKEKNKFYNIFRCNKVDKVCILNDFELVVGSANLDNPISDFDEFVVQEIAKISHILSNNTSVNRKLIEYMNILKQYQERK